MRNRWLFAMIVLIVSTVASCSPSEPGLSVSAEDSANETVQSNESKKASEHSLATASGAIVRRQSKAAAMPEVSSRDFADGSEGNLPDHFVELAPEESGIDLVHVWDPPEIHRSLINPIFGTGVAIGDYDDDGMQDVFVASQTEGGRLYRNLGGMRFEDVSDQAGIRPGRMWGVGTTFVDVNNDGRLDLYLCGYDCPNRLYINQGDGRFSEQAGEYGLNFSGASIVANFMDYDRDGDLDAYLVTNHLNVDEPLPKKLAIQRPGQPPEVPVKYRERIYLTPLPDGGYEKTAAGQFDHLYRNDNGKFVDVTETAGIGWQPYLSLSANWWDYNQDGWPDLYVANDYKGPDFLYRNNGPGRDGQVTFTDVIREACPHTPWYSMGSDFSDINNDGRMDYLATDMAGTTHYKDKLSMGNMSGPDSLAWFLNWPTPPQYMRNAVYLNTGTPHFMEIAFLTGLEKTDWTWTTRFSDFDNDGLEDVYFTNGMTRDLLNSDLKDELRRLQMKHVKSGDKTKSVADIAHEFWTRQQPYRLQNLVFQNAGDLKFKDVSQQWKLDHVGVSTGAATADLDGDGDLDLVVTGFLEPVRVYRNDLATGNSIRFRLIGTSSTANGLGATVQLQVDSNRKQVRYLSPTRGFMSTSEAIAHFGIGDANQIDSVTILWPSGVQQELTDLTANKLYTIVERGGSERTASSQATESESQPMFRQVDLANDILHLEVEYNDYRRQPLLPNKYSQLGPGMAWGDIDSDGDEDLYVGGAAGQAGQLFRRTKDGLEPSVQPLFNEDLNCEDMSPLFFDADGDGDLDLYVVSGGVECEPEDKLLQDRLYLNDGSGQFTASQLLPDLRFSGGPVAAADFDRDGDLDLFVGGRIVPGHYPESPRSALLENTPDGYVDATQRLAPELMQCGMVSSAIWSDVDGDEWPDLLTAVEWGPISLYRNESGKFVNQTESVGLSQRSGWYNSITGGDVDNDGDTDFVVGNFGLNTKYKASKEVPALLYYGDFDGAGKKQIVEAKFENGVCLPQRGLSCSSHAMPIIREKLPTFHEFALSDLSGIYTHEKLEEADEYGIDSLESGVLINGQNDSGEIRFEFRPLPRIAQASPIFGSALADVNGDGALDLYVVQNFYGPQRETGYFDGGVSLLLLGRANGDFTPVMPCDSGLVVTGDATSLTTTDWNGDGHVDFLVGRNNSTCIAFVNNAINDAKVEDVAESPSGKARAQAASWPVGTRVRLRSPSGAVRLHEITAGGGYMSQSSKAIYGNVTFESLLIPKALVSQTE